MFNRRTLTMIFVFSLSLMILSISLLIFHLMDHVDFFLETPTFILILIIGCLGFILAVMSFFKIQVEVEYKIDELEDTEKSIRDIYQYDQLIDPPDMNN